MMHDDLIGTAERFSLRESTAALTTGYHDRAVEDKVIQIFESHFASGSSSSEMLIELQAVLESLRSTPYGHQRIAEMNAFVRALGQPAHLAAFLEAMRSSMTYQGPERTYAENSIDDDRHCIYGWAGPTGLMNSGSEPTSGTRTPTRAAEERYPYSVAEWGLSIHVWQPQPGAQGFESTKVPEPNSIVEPPHSHPFSFVSYVAIGNLRQSIYHEAADDGRRGRYRDTVLQRVDGVWPPHSERTPMHVTTVEDRVALKAGDSYFMPTGAIHDVEVNRSESERRPAITVFLAAEITNVPHAYMVPSMADFQEENPGIARTGTALTPEEWDAKLASIAAYVRGEAQELRLGEVFDCMTSYGFMNV